MTQEPELVSWIHLNRGDLRLSGKITVRVIGKGNKMRLIPISPKTGNILKAYFKSNGIDMDQTGSPLFFNRSNNRLTRPGVTYILQKYVAMARDKNPGYFTKTVSAHMVRHSKATNLLLSGVNLIYIRDFLGHASVITTEIYAKTNPEFMRKAIEENNAVSTIGTEKYSIKEKKELTEFLKQYRL
ncbi:tyrosine-type recombinase/integrase [Aquibacillus sp. 3ASR75-54]|uniref:Tyrosine-type recombinase/integrase n=2 Tax=Aquibacillus salsiterrae TaxID=2950439 RepID=A0A9X3WJT7_9BACI|nr:tyrosine-type recombinase/integrase [Aquibacillus salsiterrae]MDC3418381.1 tyrosine-type recombinase/integrase [Aquibacillus salsiterrae]